MWSISPLASHHDRSNFDCGERRLDDWLKSLASQWTRKGFARVFVATGGKDSISVAGYYTISSHYVTSADLDRRQSKGLPPNVDIPTILIGRLAVDRSYQGKGLGRFLLFNALARCARIADAVGIAAVEVEAIGNTARQFYTASGFRSLQGELNHLFVSIKEVRALKLPPPT